MISLFDPIKILYYLIPVWAFLIWRFLPVSKRKWLIVVMFWLACLGFIFYLDPVRIHGVTLFFPLYTSALTAYLVAFSRCYDRFNRVLAVSLWILFVAADFWEIPVFVYDIVGLAPYTNWASDPWNFNILQWMFSHVHRIYVLMVFVLFAILTSFRFNRRVVALLISGLFLNFVLLWPAFTGNFIIHVIAPRVSGLVFFGLAMYEGVKNRCSMVRAKS